MRVEYYLHYNEDRLLNEDNTDFNKNYLPYIRNNSIERYSVLDEAILHLLDIISSNTDYNFVSENIKERVRDSIVNKGYYVWQFKDITVWIESLKIEEKEIKQEQQAHKYKMFYFKDLKPGEYFSPVYKDGHWSSDYQKIAGVCQMLDKKASAIVPINCIEWNGMPDYFEDDQTVFKIAPEAVDIKR